MNGEPEARLILGSASRRRRKILSELGVRFRPVVPLVEELEDGGHPRREAQENARRKSAWCRKAFAGCWSIAADTVIDFGGRGVGKPSCLEEARNCLRMFSGKTHTVLTAVAMASPGGVVREEVVASSVTFRRLRESDIEAYLSRVDPLDKAGAYDIDQDGDLIVASYEGSYSSIMGLPKENVSRWLREEGLLA